MYEYRATIDRWVDGDTVELTVDLGFRIYQQTSVRLLGVDTPERGQAGYTPACDYVRMIAPVGSAVVVRTRKDETEKYGRYLASIWIASGVSVANLLLEEGLGRPYDGGKR